MVVLNCDRGDSHVSLVSGVIIVAKYNAVHHAILSKPQRLLLIDILATAGGPRFALTKAQEQVGIHFS